MTWSISLKVQDLLQSRLKPLNLTSEPGKRAGPCVSHPVGRASEAACGIHEASFDRVVARACLVGSL